MIKAAFFLVILFAITFQTIIPGRAQSSVPSDSLQVIEVVAKTFEFNPSEIHVKIGERVQIKLHTADRAHGLKLSIYPEGEREDGTPGLVFEHPQDDAKVDKHKDRVIEFVAARPGIYNFKCSVQCSMGHGHDRMTGKLIVDE